MRIIAGLGNPGVRYAGMRHNVGFMVLDRLANHYGTSPWRAKHNALIAEDGLAGKRTLLIKPQSFMNACGLPIAKCLRFVKAQVNQLLVVHDDVDLAAGKIRLKQGGGHGGHNGLKDIDRHLGAGYWRLRIGVGRPPVGVDTDRHVLANFDQADQIWLGPLLDALVAHWDIIYSDSEGDISDATTARFMNAIALSQKGGA